MWVLREADNPEGLTDDELVGIQVVLRNASENSAMGKQSVYYRAWLKLRPHIDKANQNIFEGE